MSTQWESPAVPTTRSQARDRALKVLARAGYESNGPTIAALVSAAETWWKFAGEMDWPEPAPEAQAVPPACAPETTSAEPGVPTTRVEARSLAAGVLWHTFTNDASERIRLAEAWTALAALLPDFDPAQSPRSATS